MVLGRAYELGRSTYQATPKYITCCLIFHCKYLSRAGSCAIEQSVWVTKTELDLNKRLKLNWNLFSTTYIPIQFGSLNALYLIANEQALYLECAFRCRRFRHINKLVDSPPKILISIQWIHQGYIIYDGIGKIILEVPPFWFLKKSPEIQMKTKIQANSGAGKCKSTLNLPAMDIPHSISR